MLQYAANIALISGMNGIGMKGVLLMLLFAVPGVRADTVAILPPAAIDAFAMGMSAVEIEEWDLAVACFEEARKAAPLEPAILLNLGLAHARANHEIPAIAGLHAYLAVAPAAGNREEILAAIEDLKHAVRVKALANYGEARVAAEKLDEAARDEARSMINSTLMLVISAAEEPPPRGILIRRAGASGAHEAMVWLKCFGVFSESGRYGDLAGMLRWAGIDLKPGQPESFLEIGMRILSATQLTADLEILLMLERRFGRVVNSDVETTLVTATPVGAAFDTMYGLPARLRHDATGIELLLVPPGAMPTGPSGGAQPAPIVPFEAYYIGATEVTNAQLRKVRPFHNSGQYRLIPAEGGAPWSLELNGVNQPAVMVTWDEADSFCAAMGLQLPTRSQWEMAARGGDGRTFPWGNAWDHSRANHADSNCLQLADRDKAHSDGFAVAAPVGSYPAGGSPCGARDMAGNVWEWCADLQEGRRIIAGGSWNALSSRLAISSSFLEIPATGRYCDVGFRVVAIPGN